MRSQPPAPNSARAKNGPGLHALQPEDLRLSDASELKNKLVSIFRSPQYKPPVLPSVALELTDLSRKPNVSYDDVIHVVEKDPLIVASVLKLAQSPLYGGRLPVHSLKDALHRLGINMLRDMVWQVVVGMRLFRVRGYTSTLERLQSHATFVAYAARIIASRAGIPAEQAFLCGLLHDVGWSGTLIAISENDKHPPEPKTLFAAIDQMHAEAGSAMAKLWGLSNEIVTVIEHHHDLALERRPQSVLVPVLVVAERFADELGFSVEPIADPKSPPPDRCDANVPGRFEHAVSLLRLEDKLDGVRDLVKEAAERIGGPDEF